MTNEPSVFTPPSSPRRGKGGRPWRSLLRGLGSVALVVGCALALSGPRPPAPRTVELGVHTATDALPLSELGPVAPPGVDAAAMPDDASPDSVGRTSDPVAPSMDPSRRLAYESRGPKTILDLQPYRQGTQLVAPDGVAASLLDLAPHHGASQLLEVQGTGGADGLYHLQNPSPRTTELTFDPAYVDGVVLVSDAGRIGCPLWADGELTRAAATGDAYAPLCEGRLWLRNPVQGHKSTREWASDFLRDRVWWGEEITVLVRDELYRDSWLRTGERVAGERSPDVDDVVGRPQAAMVDPARDGVRLVPDGLGLPVSPLDGEASLAAGRWEAVDGQPGVYVSAYQVRLVPEGLREAHERWLAPISDVEEEALVYLVAFDLEQLELSFALGTDHPRLGWSERVPRDRVDPALPGPDGFDTDVPLVRTGQVPPWEAGRLAATFTAGFKRRHGAFRYGALSTENDGSHYGFIENGVVHSKLVPGLATLVVRDDGMVSLQTWSAEDDDSLYRIRHARQNGVPLVERDEQTGALRPGSLVSDWKAGNWCGSPEGHLRTLRAATCIQDSPSGRFLIYGYWTGATPSGMALVSLAYGCAETMALDMNALEHTYLAVYERHEDDWVVRHLDEGMAVLDKTTRDGRVLPRFVAFPDNRDFFWLTRKEAR